MRLVTVEFFGYKRLKSTKINLDAPVGAVVGPNEAGKTSLLDGLAHLSQEGPFAPGELTRKTSPEPSHVIIRGWFLLDPDDRAQLAHIPEAAGSRWFVVSKLADGRLALRLDPRIERTRAQRRRARVALSRVATLSWAKGTLYESTDARSLAEVANGLIELVDDQIDTLPPSTLETLRELSERLKQPGGPKSVAQAIERIDALGANEVAPHPRDVARDALRSRVPQLLKFEVEARNLASEYDLAALDLAKPPPAIANLASLAGLDLEAAVAAVQSNDYGDKLRLVEDANRTLEAIFRAAWTQPPTIVRLDMDETLLRVFVPNPGGGYSAIAERSDGVRAFVALIAFTALAGGQVKPILLVDEAETHLHYDAQADLVRVFTRQTAAAKVIYTTHSAGCLPEDLGTGIRMISQIEGADASRIQNSFWTEGGGFGNLLLGMGASVLAFASTRRALIAEGGADLILLPTLFREAMSRSYVGFQVAPGLAEATPLAIAELDLAAARVAYIVDDDDAGRRIVTKLRSAGVPANHILVLGRGRRRGMVLEDVIERTVFRNAVNLELERSGVSPRLPLARIAARGRPAAVDRWAETEGVSTPNRTAVARRVLDLAGAQTVLSAAGRRVIVELFEDAARVLGVT